MEFHVISFLLGIAAGLVVFGALFFVLGVTYRKKVAEKEIGEQEHEALIEKFIDELGEGS